MKLSVPNSISDDRRETSFEPPVTGAARRPVYLSLSLLDRTPRHPPAARFPSMLFQPAQDRYYSLTNSLFHIHYIKTYS